MYLIRKETHDEAMYLQKIEPHKHGMYRDWKVVPVSFNVSSKEKSNPGYW
jgi:hypothetical protein